MTLERWQQITDIFEAALTRDPGSRAAFVAEACPGDDDLRQEVEAMLSSHERAGGFIESPAVEVAARQSGTEASLTGQTIAHYQVLSLLGSGGMGDVYLALDTKLGRKVALKLLPEYLAGDTQRARLFTKEARAASALNHPNIITIHEIGQMGERYYIAMEYIEGETLGSHIHRDQTGLPKLLKYLQQVAEGLTKAHAAGIVHRDLKPDNIMITQDGYAKILDFGLAKLVERPGTAEPSEAATAVMAPTSIPGMVTGTLGYMSPEQAQGKSGEIDHRSDIFSFGCILYEAATSQRAFEGKDVLDSLHKIVHAPTPSLLGISPQAMPDLERIVRRCLQKDPEKRYQSIKDVAIELEELRQELKGETEPLRAASSEPAQPGAVTNAAAAASTNELTARPTSSAEYLVGEVKRHKSVALLAVVGLIAVAVAAYFYFVPRGRTINSLAVLPFVNTSNDSQTEYLSDGITESLINSLSRLPNLKVMSRNSVFRYKGRETDAQAVGRELGVEAVLTGRVVQHGDGIVISVELVSARDNTHLWGEKYNRKLSDLLAVQGDISREVLEKLRLRLTGEEERRATHYYTENAEAYQLYLKGRYFWERARTLEELNKSVDYFQQAIRLDPKYALAYAGLAEAYASFNGRTLLPPNEVLPKAKEAALKALELDQNLAEAHSAVAQIKYQYDWDWTGAAEEFRKAVELNPNSAKIRLDYGWYLMDLERFDEALRELYRAQELEPLSPLMITMIGRAYYFLHRYDDALKQYHQALELDPHFGAAHLSLISAYWRRGMSPEAMAESEQYLISIGSPPEQIAAMKKAYQESNPKFYHQFWLDNHKERMKRGYVSPYDMATLYASLDQKDQAFEWLERAYQEHNPTLARLKIELEFEDLRWDARYADLLRRIGLPL